MIKGKEKVVRVLEHQEKYAKLTDTYCAMVSGFGAGKTIGMIWRAINLAKRRRKQKIKPVICIITPTYGEIRDTVRPKLIEELQTNKIAYVERKQEKKIILPAFGMAEIWFRSASKPERIVGFDATDMLLDEFDLINTVDQQEEVWNKCLGRLRKTKDFSLGVTTTPEGYKLTYQKFKKEKIGTLMQLNTADNIYLPDEYIENLKDQYDTLLVEQYVNGKFVNIKGHRAYYAFDRDKQQIKEYKPKGRELIIGWDFNVDPMSITIGQLKNNKIIFFDEIKIHDANTYKGCETLLEKYPNDYWQGRTGKTSRWNLIAFPDQTGRARKTSAIRSDIQILKKYGIEVEGRSNDFQRVRLNATNGALSNSKVYITENCVDTIEDLEQTITDQHGNIDKTDSKRTHFSDAFSYPVSRIFPIKKKRSWEFRSY